jgi:hypothetical protein
MDKVQKPINSECHTLSSEPFGVYFNTCGIFLKFYRAENVTFQIEFLSHLRNLHDTHAALTIWKQNVELGVTSEPMMFFAKVLRIHYSPWGVGDITGGDIAESMSIPQLGIFTFCLRLSVAHSV